MTDVETYKWANIDRRRLFSKIQNEAEYSPKKKTAFAIALKLNEDEQTNCCLPQDITLSSSSKFDVILYK
ncbi:hypothetical protein [Metabacillus schmidteae]|uniref:hypothetical protein n=1 Tax=Metabacillus schmidteae TaxID=2730405 RepID=UPI00158A60F0|nr:hypothetical protein [Metabacillus schmidteae]